MVELLRQLIRPKGLNLVWCCELESLFYSFWWDNSQRGVAVATTIYESGAEWGRIKLNDLVKSLNKIVF